MITWTFYTLADWWNPLEWRWAPGFESYPGDVAFNWLFFTVRREEDLWW